MLQNKISIYTLTVTQLFCMSSYPELAALFDDFRQFFRDKNAKTKCLESWKRLMGYRPRSDTSLVAK